MKLSEAQPIDLLSGIKLISENHKQSHIWVVVKNACGCVFELSGTSEEIQAVIPYYEDGKILCHSNGYTTSKYYLRTNFISTSTRTYSLPKLTDEEFINYLQQTDFRQEILEIAYDVILVEKYVEKIKLLKPLKSINV